MLIELSESWFSAVILATPRRWRARHLQIDADASSLIEQHGDAAYYSARDYAREARNLGDRLTDQHWSRVAVRIAERIGHKIGETVADRYEADR